MPKHSSFYLIFIEAKEVKKLIDLDIKSQFARSLLNYDI